MRVTPSRTHSAVVVFVCAAVVVEARHLTFSNTKPRMTVDGDIVDSHSSVVVELNGT
jgi:hypothetical protein